MISPVRRSLDAIERLAQHAELRPRYRWRRRVHA
jgi:hypothetical protein